MIIQSIRNQEKEKKPHNNDHLEKNIKKNSSASGPISSIDRSNNSSQTTVGK
jgi:hypothetical protein